MDLSRVDQLNTFSVKTLGREGVLDLEWTETITSVARCQGFHLMLLVRVTHAATWFSSVSQFGPTLDTALQRFHYAAKIVRNTSEQGNRIA